MPKLTIFGSASRNLVMSLFIALAMTWVLMAQQSDLIREFDTDGDGKLNPEERIKMLQSVSDRSGASERSMQRAQESGPLASPNRGQLGGPTNGAFNLEPESITQKFDQNGDGRLDASEREAARQEAQKMPRRGPRLRDNRSLGVPAIGPSLSPKDVSTYPEEELYASDILKTVFLNFDIANWEEELEAFYRTDVEIPARLELDGQVIEEVGVRFRGNTSSSMVPPGRKKSLNISVNFSDKDQKLQGFKTLNLLNAHTDPTVMREVLFGLISQEYQPSLKANHMRVVINGENWGIYVNSQQFDSIFLTEAFGTSKGIRWKKPANPREGNGMAYLGDDPVNYRGFYELKTSLDDPRDAWDHYIRMAKALAETPVEELAEVMEPYLNVDGALWFLALENVFIDSDGYWVRASDFNFYQDPRGRFHMIAHDNNETFRWPGGPGLNGQIQGASLDPLFGVGDANKPLLRLLENPQLRMRYLAHVRTIADDWLDWGKLEPIIKKMRQLIEGDIKKETRRPGGETHADFLAGLTQSLSQNRSGENEPPSLQTFIEQRREFLSQHPLLSLPVAEIQSLEVGNPESQTNPLGRLMIQTQIKATLASGHAAASQLVLHVKSSPMEPFSAKVMTPTGDGVFEIILKNLTPGQDLYYYLEARGKSGLSGSAFFPTTASHQPFQALMLPKHTDSPNGLIITRVMADNQNYLADPQGDFDDWIELTNAGEQPVELSEIFLSDDGQRPLKWTFPPNTPLAANEKIIVWADGESNGDIGFHANFKLSAESESVYLSRRSKGQIQLLDHFSFQHLRPNQVATRAVNTLKSQSLD